VRALGLVVPVVREGAELLYQFAMPFVVGTRLPDTFRINATPVDEAVRATFDWNRGAATTAPELLSGPPRVTAKSGPNVGRRPWTGNRQACQDASMTQMDQALARLRDALVAAQAAFVKGNAEPFKALWSHGDDVTILGAFGGFEQGWDLVGLRLDWASSQFQDGVSSYTNLSTHITQDLVCLVDIERTEARLGGGRERVIQELRATQVLRREGDEFRVIHRHADSLRPTAPPGG
jgi:hypothetical protein